MKHCIKITLTAGFLLASCAPLQIYYKEGETVARMDRDQTACEVGALRQVPADIHRRYIPPVYDRYRVCYANGYCRWHSRLISPGRYESFDANAPLRGKVANQCMADKGYLPTKIKRCDAETTRMTPKRTTQVLPPLSPQSCAIRFRSGRWQIVTPDAG